MGHLEQSDGFTLIELMIVVTLLAIFASIATPSFTSFVNNNRVQSTSNELASLLQLARSSAVQNNASFIVCLDAANQWTVRRRGPTTNATTLCSLPVVRSMDTPAGVNIVASANAFPLIFNANGTAANIARLISCHNAEFTNGYMITIANSGATRAWPQGFDQTNTALTNCTP